MDKEAEAAEIAAHRATQGSSSYYDVFPAEHKLLIDVHHHYDSSKKDFVSSLLKDMDAAGVHKVCLFTSKPDYGQKERKDWRRIFSECSDRIIGFGTLNPGRLPENKPEVIDSYFSEGFKGLKFTRPTDRYDTDKFLVYYEKAEEYDMPVLFHTGVIARRSFDEREDISSMHMRPIYLDRIARWCPRLKMIAAHMGDPWFNEAYNTSQKNPLIWLDISGKGMWLKAKAIRKYLWIRLRPEKLLFGLDEPSSHYSRIIHAWDTILYEMGLTQEQRDKIFGETAEEILGTQS